MKGVTVGFSPRASARQNQLFLTQPMSARTALPEKI
jgi:hypothetical protein